MKYTKLLMGIALVILFAQTQTKAQGMFTQDVNGSPIREKKYVDVNGSPYLIDTWEKAVVQLDNGQTYNVDVKYDLVADELTFRSNKGDSLTFVKPVKEFKLAYINNNKNETHIFRSGFPSTGAKTTEKSFYEVLYDGGTKLLKKQAKSIWTESTSYGTATQTKNITPRTTYFVAKEGKMLPLKLDRKSVISALADKSSQVEQYIKENKLEVKNDEDLIKVFAYYNSLK